MKKLFFTLCCLLSIVLLLVGCGNNTQLKSDSGITADGKFDKEMKLVGTKVSKDSQEGIAVLAKLDNKPIDKSNVTMFDISIIKNGTKVQPNDSVKISLPMPNINVNEYVGYHIKDDGNVETLELSYKNGNIEFYVSSFSVFVFSKKLETPPKPLTYEVFFETNGGNSIDKIEYNSENGLLSLPVATKDGYNFDGWHEKADLSVIV